MTHNDIIEAQRKRDFKETIAPGAKRRTREAHDT